MWLCGLHQLWKTWPWCESWSVCQYEHCSWWQHTWPCQNPQRNKCIIGIGLQLVFLPFFDQHTMTNCGLLLGSNLTNAPTDLCTFLNAFLQTFCAGSRFTVYSAEPYNHRIWSDMCVCICRVQSLASAIQELRQLPCPRPLLFPRELQLTSQEAARTACRCPVKTYCNGHCCVQTWCNGHYREDPFSPM